MPDDEGHPERDEMCLAAVLSAVNDPLRRKVVRDLAHDEPDAERTCVSFELGVSKSTLTHHFRVLREAGLVRQVDRGNSRKVRLRRQDVDARFPGLIDLIADEG